MAEYIEREALIADIEKRYCKPCEAEGKDYNHVRCRACWVDDMVGEIEETPIADVVPVVRCSECEKWQKKEESWLCKNFGYCTECMMDCPADHFCSYGNRKDGDG